MQRRRPHAVGAKELLPALLDPLIGLAGDVIDRVLFAPPVPVPGLPTQSIHEDDVGDALAGHIIRTGLPDAAGAVNISFPVASRHGEQR
jgi:hypothetical protein